jgi:hypothetical protein
MGAEHRKSGKGSGTLRMTENISQATEDRLLRMMADQSAEIEAIRKNVSERLTALERPRRSLSGLLDMDFSSVASIAVLAIVALILTRVLMHALAQTKRRAVTDVESQMS